MEFWGDKGRLEITLGQPECRTQEHSELQLPACPGGRKAPPASRGIVGDESERGGRAQTLADGNRALGQSSKHRQPERFRDAGGEDGSESGATAIEVGVREVCIRREEWGQRAWGPGQD